MGFEVRSLAGSGTKQSHFIDSLNGSQNRLFAYVYAHTLNLADTEDLYQQVVMVLWEKFDQFRPDSDFGSWAIRVAEFTIKNFLRGKRRSKMLFSAEVIERIAERQSDISQDAANARTNALKQCLQRLPAVDRELVECCYAGDLKIRDIAENSGRSPGAVYTSLSRIRQALLSCIERTIAAEGRS